MKTPLELGEILKAARQAEQLELSELSVRTGLPEKYLLALERGAHEELPGRAYARIYYLNYARALNLDHETLMLSWPQPVSTPEAAPARPPRPKGRVLVWLGLPLAALALWGIFQGTATISQRVTDSAGSAPGSSPGAIDTTPSMLDAGTQSMVGSVGVAGTATTELPVNVPPVVAAPPVLHRLRLMARTATSVVIVADGDTTAEEILSPGRELVSKAAIDFVLTIALPQMVDVTLDGEPLELPDAGLHALVDHRIPLHSPEDGP